MAFESLTEKLQNVFKNLRGKGRLSEEDVTLALKEVRMALLEADVNFKVVKDFTKSIKEKAVGTDVLNGLNPAQTVIKLVDTELTQMMGSEMAELTFAPGKEITVIMMMGLQGAGKTTSAAKLAGKLKKKGKNPLLVACDIYRPAAIEQLRVNGQKNDTAVFEMGTNPPPEIAKASMDYAKSHAHDVVILDTAGRLHIDEDLLLELNNIKEAVTVHNSILVVDAMTGQDAVNVASSFEEAVGIDGVILTKLDGDARGGAALSLRAVCGKPIVYVGMGEKLSDFEEFHPDRMAGRILGMGDVLSMIEKAQETISEEEAIRLEKKIRKSEFDYEDYLASMKQMQNLGGISSIMSMIPGLGKISKAQREQIENNVDDKALKHTEAIILSMTPAERKDPSLMNLSRKHRLAKGAGLDIAEVNRFIKQFEQSRKLMKQMAGKKGKMKLPFGM